MATFAQARQETLQLLDETISLSQNNAEQRKRLTETREQLVQGKLNVVVAGEFKRGKSSLINAFLNDPHLLPTDQDLATNVVSCMVYGERERVRVLLGEPGQDSLQDITRVQIRDYVSEQGNPGNRRNARMLVLELPNPQLRDGLTLVDTPGIGSVVREHTAITYAYLPNADVVLFVTNALKPLTTDDLTFLRERVLPHTRHLLFVITRIDEVQDYERIVTDTRAKLAAALQCPPDAVRIAAVSNSLKLRYIEATRPDPADLEESNFPAFEEALWQLLRERRGQILLQRALVETGRALAQLRAPMQEEWEAMQQRTQAELDAQEDRLREAQRRLKSLTAQSADWQNMLSDGLADIRMALKTQFDEGFVQIQRRVSNYVEDRRLVTQPERIVGLLEADVDALMVGLSQALNAEASTLHGRLEAATGLDINPFQETELNWQRPDFNPGNRPMQTESIYEKAITVGRKGLWDTGAGAVIGGLLGGIVGGAVGLLFGGIGAIPGAQAGASLGATIGGIGGQFNGLRKGLREVTQPDMNRLVPLLRDFLEDSRRTCDRSFTDAVVEMERALRNELRGQLSRAIRSAEDSLTAVQAARGRTDDQTIARRQTVQQQIQQLNRLQERAAALARLADSFSAPVNAGAAASPRPSSPTSAPPPPPPPAVEDGDRGEWANG